MVLPRQSNYETAKHGIETLSDSLRLEMIKFGVNVSIVEPGMYGRCTSVLSTEMVSLIIIYLQIKIFSPHRYAFESRKDFCMRVSGIFS
jgi:NAD(P)-dependent dehydrogenase (short-subunit alcohol dehydrogenase family)